MDPETPGRPFAPKTNFNWVAHFFPLGPVSLIEVKVSVRAIPRAGVGNDRLFASCGHALPNQRKDCEQKDEDFHEENLTDPHLKSIAEEVIKIDSFILDCIAVIAPG